MKGSIFLLIMGKSAGTKLPAEDQAALKVASAKRLAEQEALRSPKKKAKTATPAAGVGTRATGKTQAGLPKTTTEEVLAAMGDDESSEGDDEGAGSEGPGDSGEEIEDENFGSVAKPVARGSYNGRENEMVIGQGAGVAKKTVNRKPTFDLAAKGLGRPLTMSEKKVLAQMSPAELKQASEGQGAVLVEMIKGLPGCG